MDIVDRRLNPKAKSLGNRQRFLRRAKAEVREAVRDALRKRKVSDVEGGEQVTIRSKSLREPSFSLNRNTGTRDFVLPGNQDYSVGDVIQKPPKGGGGGRGSKGSPDGSGDDDFVFSLSKEEFLDIFFEDLRLPNLVKAKLKDLRTPVPARAGFQSEGPPAKLNRLRTMRNSLARRIALRRPSEEEIRRALEEAEQAEREGAAPERVAELKAKAARLTHLRKVVAYIDPLDLQYNRFERLPKPTTQAVMFCLMDVSASMTEPLKDLAKQFFMLLHVFLSRHYREVDVVFIRHTTEAAEVDEETFFRATETGGTVISSALEIMLKVIGERYPVEDWNIYAAQASDGHNFDDDMERCISMLDKEIMPRCQYFGYVEVSNERMRQTEDSVVWAGYQELLSQHPHFAMKRVNSPSDIYPVFRELFSRSVSETRGS